MKKIILSFFCFFITGIMFSQPGLFKYQAVLRDASGNLQTNKNVTIVTSILKSSIAGTVSYSESHAASTNAFGIVNLNIGEGTVISGSMATINWSEGPYFIKISVDGTEMGTSQLLSVPYALYAKEAGNGFSGDYNDLINRPSKLDLDSTNDVTIKSNQTIEGKKTFTDSLIIKKGVDVSNSRIINVAKPLQNNDAVNKSYVDSLAQRINEFEVLNNKLRDVEGNLYSVMKIKDQIWMSENLRSTKYRDGSPIPLVTINANWTSATEGYCNFMNDDNYSQLYGRLYHSGTVYSDPRGVCPLGWHIPTEAEWDTLIAYLGGSSVASFKLKQTGTTNWTNPNLASNESGLNFLPCGNRASDGSFSVNGSNGSYWFSINQSGLIMLQNVTKITTKAYDASGNIGGAIRCIKDK